MELEAIKEYFYSKSTVSYINNHLKCKIALNYVTLVDNTISLGDCEKPFFYGRVIHKPWKEFIVHSAFGIIAVR